MEAQASRPTSTPSAAKTPAVGRPGTKLVLLLCRTSRAEDSTWSASHWQVTFPQYGSSLTGTVEVPLGSSERIIVCYPLVKSRRQSGLSRPEYPDDLGLVGPVHRLGQCVVVRIASRADRTYRAQLLPVAR